MPSAGAANGDPLTLGASNSATASTFLDASGTAGYGLNVTNSSSGGVGLSGNGNFWGVRGLLSPPSPVSGTAAVRGVSFGQNQYGPGVWGSHSPSIGTAPGVLGDTNSSFTNASGVSGVIVSSADYAAGVRGENLSTACCGFGVVGFSNGQGIGIGGYAPNGFGVFGYSPYNWAAWLDGAVTVTKDLHVNGTLYKGAGAFRIDNPLDPAHSYLQHSFVESPQMMNVYNGNVTTNSKGFVTVQLPKWFQALNKDFRYELTVVGKAHWDAKAAIWQEVKDNRFTIRTDQPDTKVSWQVTGVRHDPYANAHRIQVVVPKEGKAQGTYLHPQLYGQPQSKGETALPGFARKMPKLKAPASPSLPEQQ
jgi:hypothetical protein